jgi:hypothetical protein
LVASSHFIMRDQILAQAVNDLMKENPHLANNAEDFLQKAWDKKIQYEIESFPDYCQEAFEANFKATQALEQIGNKGRFTDSYGWTNDRTMLASYIVPMNLKMFMINLVYFDFWEDSNQKVRDSFMKQICRGGCKEDFKLLLAKVVRHYGSNTGELISKVAA